MSTNQSTPFIVINPNAVSLEIGKAEIWACVPGDRAPQAVLVFPIFTPSLKAPEAWSKKCNIDSVAAESIGVSWIPVYEPLEEHGFKVNLVKARHLKNVPGCKNSYQDCQWIQYLHNIGLLNGSFRPEAEICGPCCGIVPA